MDDRTPDHRLGPEHAQGAFRPEHPPVLTVTPGETVRFETSGDPIEAVFEAGERWAGGLDVTAVNLVTGPVAIDGVAPGDAVEVEILAIEPGPWGWNASIPGFGPVSDRLPPLLRRLPIRDGHVVLSPRLRLPVAPMVGCLGLAPARGATSTLSPPEPWGGNYDLVQARPGATLLFPAQVAGGLFSLGDLHAAMGANEGTSVAIECPGAATVRLGVRKGLRLTTPRIETADRLSTVGLQPRGCFLDARRQALGLMWDLLVVEAACTPEEAFGLISAAVDVELGGPAGMVVLASVPRSLLPERR